MTLIAYTFVIGGHVPNVSYLTRMDYFVFGSTVLVFGSLVQVVFTGVMAKDKIIRTAGRIDRWSRIIFPALFGSLFLYSFVF